MGCVASTEISEVASTEIAEVENQTRINFMEEEEDEDIISSLPDCLLIEILSRLPSTNEVIRTSVVSKRWQHLWTLIPILNIYERRWRYPLQPLSVFYNSVDKTITQCRNQCQTGKLHIFKLDTKFHVNFQSKLNSWIRYAITCNVQQLYLTLQPSTCDPEAVPRYEFDQLPYAGISFVLKDDLFFNNSCLTHLKLKLCVFDPFGPISWNGLKSLSISDAKLDEDLIQNIMSGSPLLETLELNYCHGFLVLDITSKSIKNLVFSGYHVPRFVCVSNIIKINAPYILSLSIKGALYLWKLLLLDVSSLVKVELDYQMCGHYGTTIEEHREEILKGLILKFLHAKELIVHDWLYYCKVLSRLKAKGFLLPSSMKLLRVYYCHDRFGNKID